MEYRKDKRTKNLSLRDIHVGDWVQVWSEQAERYSPPLKITQICDDGTVYLIIHEDNRLDPWEENIKDIDALPIDADLLRGFGFSLKDSMGSSLQHKFYEVYYNKIHIGFTPLEFDCNVICVKGGKCRDMVELHQVLSEHFPTIKLEWKGIEK